MRKSILFAALIALAACASKPTEQKTTEKAATATTDSKASTVATAKEETKTSTKSAKHSAKKSETATETVASALTCKAGTDERKLAIQSKEAGCELAYTKSGETKTIASQIKGNEKCEQVLTSIKEKLVAAKFNCE